MKRLMFAIAIAWMPALAHAEIDPGEQSGSEAHMLEGMGSPYERLRACEPRCFSESPRAEMRRHAWTTFFMQTGLAIGAVSSYALQRSDAPEDVRIAGTIYLMFATPGLGAIAGALA